MAILIGEMTLSGFVLTVLGAGLGGILVLAGMGAGLILLNRLRDSAHDRDQAKTMSRLNQAARAIHRDQGTALLERIVNTARSLTGADLGALVVFAPDPTADPESITRRAGTEIEPAHDEALLQVLSRRPDLEQTEEIWDLRDLLPGSVVPWGPWLAVPLRAGDQLLGTLAVANPLDQPAFEATSLAIMLELGHHALTALQKARHESELEDTNSRLARASQLKTEFLANMSHELRTPLSAIIGFSDLLLDRVDGSLSQEQEQDVLQINRSGKVLLALINDILDLSKIEAGQISLAIGPVPIASLIREVMASLRPMAEAKQLFLRDELPTGNPAMLCDPLRTRQVLNNLISNAIKFTERGGVTVRCNDDLEVSIEDTGIGISEEARERIFQQLTQGDGSSSRSFGGTGMGLSISRKLVELQGGEIGVESKLGYGSRFWFRLPMASWSGMPIEPSAQPVRPMGARPAPLRQRA